MTVLITGANGFVGSTLSARLQQDGVPASLAVRAVNAGDATADKFAIGCISAKTNWSYCLNNVKQIVHLAARVHVMRDRSTNPLAEFRRVNLDGTTNLARQAALAGVRRFIFLSTIKVNGESTEHAPPFTADCPPVPTDSYGISKHEAEQALLKIASETGMEVVIIRPPIVYGNGVRANFEVMMRWLVRDIPLPLAGITNNRRSLVSLENLVDLIVTCLHHPAAANQTFLVSDGEDLSTADLLRRLGSALGHPANLFYAPPRLLEIAANIAQKPEMYLRLCRSLQLDTTKTRNMLGWMPPLSVDDGLLRTAEGFLRL
jgi:nucleoside-diphosphate-sugar epimerase